MAPNFRLISTSPGQARIDITGVEIPAKDKGPKIAFQRASDELYIGSDGSWQSDPGWHRLGRIPDPATTAFLVGSGVVDALADVSRADSFRASARWKDGQGEGVLRIVGELIGSAGLKREPPKVDDGGGHSPLPRPWPIPPVPLISPDGSQNSRPPFRWVLPVGGAFVALASAAALWLVFGPSDPPQPLAPQGTEAHQPGTGQSSDAGASQTASNSGANVGQSPYPQGDHPGAIPGAGPTQADGLTAAPRIPTDRQPDIELEDDTQPGQPKDPARDTRTQSYPAANASAPSPGVAAGSKVETGAVTKVEPQPEPTPYDAPQLRGRDYVSWLVDQSPDATTYQSQAKRRARQGDCPAVILLYDRAARSSPEVAAQVARLYDPVGFQPSPCIDQPSPSNAREYYELAGDGGVQDVQPRLNEILSRGQESAPSVAPIPANRTWENRQ